MSYKTYITDAVVCGAFDHLTSDRSYLLFTREAGMLFASAKSVREERSKHRYALQEFSRARITLVRGKAGWRITGTEPLGNFYTTLTSRDARATLRNSLRLLRRVVQGETPHPALFDDIITGLSLLTQSEGKTLEVLLSLRILHALGYVADTEELSVCIEKPFVEAHAELDPARIPTLETHIARALTESHL